ncbi:MAG: LPS export ABC transporter periplasmic protein LptC [Chitinophagaceae bacterium]
MKILFYIFLVSFFITACENDMKVVNELSIKKIGVEEGKYIESYMSTAGKVKAKLTAPFMLRNQYDSAKVEFPKTLNVEFYDSLLNPESYLFAKYGKYLEFDNTVLLRDSIVVYNIKNDTIWSNELIWDQNKGTFYTDKPVIISQDNGTVRQKIFARGMQSDQTFKNVDLFKIGGRFNNNVNSFIILKDSSQM